MASIKESHDVKSLNMSTLFRKLIPHGHGLKRLQVSENISKIEEKNKDDRKNISLKASKDDEDDMRMILQKMKR